MTGYRPEEAMCMAGADLEATLLELEERQWAANRAADPEFYRRYCADDFRLVSRFGVWDKQRGVAELEKGNVNPFLRTDMEDPIVIELGDGTALLTYKETIDAEIRGQRQVFSIYATSVFRRTDDGWRYVFHQQTPIDAPPG
jgi:ketosteroid isomerase-like protein